MSTNILFIFEGEKTEKQITDSLQKEFFSTENTIITSAYCGEIYQLYKEILGDEDLDTFNLVKEKKANAKRLKKYNRSDFAEIYLFFDYDGHSSTADDEKLKQLLKLFNEETDKGKLYISYPMVESLKHVNINCYNSFRTLNVDCKKNINYKNLVHTECLNELQDFRKYEITIWKQLIEIHLKKMNYIVFDLFEFPQEIISQSTIFSKQLEKHIRNEYPNVAVLSAFPVFIHDYYGNQRTKVLVSN